jgi:cardiolipin synthase
VIVLKIERVLKMERIEDRSEDKIGLSWTLRSQTQMEKTAARDGTNPSSKTGGEPENSGTMHANSGLFAVPNNSSLMSLISGLIESASEVVCLSSFLLQDSPIISSIFKAAEKGVRVYVLTAGEDDLKVADEDDTQPLERVAEFKKLLGKLSDKILLRTGDFHAKFLLIDPALQSRKGMMLTSNLTVDALSGSNMELAVFMTPSEVMSFFNQFIVGFWTISRHELRKGRLQEFAEKEYMPDVKSVRINHPNTCGKVRTIKEAALELINGARSSITIAAWTFSPTTEICKALLAQAEKGIKVVVYTRPNYLNATAMEQLAEKGVTVKAHERYHAKVISVDGDRCLITTSNFSERGLDIGFETGVLRNGRDAAQLEKIIEGWDNKCGWVLSTNARLGDLEGQIIEIEKSRQDVVKRAIIDTKTVELKDQHLQELKPRTEIMWPEMKYSNLQGELCKRIQFRWSAIMPAIPEGATEINLEGSDRKFYQKKGEKRLYLPVYDWEDIPEAKEEAKKFGATVVMG